MSYDCATAQRETPYQKKKNKKKRKKYLCIQVKGRIPEYFIQSQLTFNFLEHLPVGWISSLSRDIVTVGVGAKLEQLT